MKIGKQHSLYITNIKKKNIFCSILVCSFMLISCGKTKNKDVPPRVDKLTKENSGNEEYKAANTRWESLTSAFEIPLNEGSSEADLKARLSTASALITDVTKNATTAAALTTEHAKTAFATRCASIASVSLLGDGGAKYFETGKTEPSSLSTATVYLLKYKLQKDTAGNEEDNPRSAIVVLPAASVGTAPLVAYSHGGDAGLSYTYGIANLFGALQASHIILAPTFPGEQICGGAAGSPITKTCADATQILADAQTGSKSEPYRTDADELLGLQDCVARATLVGDAKAIAVPTTGQGPAFLTRLATAVKRIGGTGPYQSLPASILVGASRGGHVANIALAKTGASLSVLGAIQKKYATDQSQIPVKQAEALGAKYYFPSFFSCNLSLFSPATFTHVRYRLLLEQLVKGLDKFSAIKYLPTGSQLVDYISPYAKGEISLETVVQRLKIIDAAYQAPLIMAALQNWSFPTVKKGAMLMIHGELDRVVTSDQSYFSGILYNDTQKALASAALAPGVNLKAVSLIPNSADYTTNVAGENELTSPTATQHADEVFNRSLGNKDILTKLGSDSDYKGKLPQEIIGTWLASECAASLSNTP